MEENGTPRIDPEFWRQGRTTHWVVIEHDSDPDGVQVGWLIEAETLEEALADQALGTYTVCELPDYAETVYVVSRVVRNG